MLDFYKAQETLTALEWVLRALVGFLFLLVVAKMLGQRSISQLRLLDFIIALTLGNIIAHPLSDEHLGLEGSMITTIVLTVLYVAATWLSLKWSPFKRYLDPHPIVLIKNGEIQFDNLSKARISSDYLFSELRKSNVDDITHVSYAAWEPGGLISIFKNPPYEPITPRHLKLETSPFNLHRPIIIDGVIEKPLLEEIGRDKVWLETEIAARNKTISEIKLATVDIHQKIKVHSSRP